MTKIAIVSSSFPPLSSGGVSSAQYGLFLSLLKNDSYQVKGFTFDDKKSELSEDNIIRSGTPVWIKKLISRILILIFKIIDRGNTSYQTADIISSAIGSLKAAYKIKKFAPEIVFVSDHGAPMFFIKRLVKAKYVWVAHHNPMRFVDNPIIGAMSIKDAKYATFIEKICTDSSSAIISPSQYMDEVIKRTHNHHVTSFVIKNLIDIKYLNSITQKRPSSVESSDLTIFIPSAGSVIKGERYVFSIMQWISSKVIDRNIVFILSGTISSTLSYEIKNNKSLRCIVLGQLPYSENIAYLKSCDLCVSPTLLESFGMSILESTLSGVPVVTFNVGGNKDLIVNGVNGYLVDYLDIKELCNMTVHLINNPLSRNSVIAETKKIYLVDEIKDQIDGVVSSLNTETL